MEHFVEIMIDENEIQKRIKELGEEISLEFGDEEVVLIGLLRGSAIFLADLSRKITSKARVDFMCISSYGDSMESSGNILIKKDLDEDIVDKNVLIIEDIIDTGTTLSKVKSFLLERNPKKLKICTLLDKPSRRIHEVDVDYIGFSIPDEFVVGYGIDYAQQYRTLPYIGRVVVKG